MYVGRHIFETYIGSGEGARKNREVKWDERKRVQQIDQQKDWKLY